MKTVFNSSLQLTSLNLKDPSLSAARSKPGMKIAQHQVDWPCIGQRLSPGDGGAYTVIHHDHMTLGTKIRKEY